METLNRPGVGGLVTIAVVFGVAIGFFAGNLVCQAVISGTHWRNAAEAGVIGYDCDPSTGEVTRYWKVPVGDFKRVEVK